MACFHMKMRFYQYMNSYYEKDSWEGLDCYVVKLKIQCNNMHRNQKVVGVAALVIMEPLKKSFSIPGVPFTNMFYL